ncbi:hypothetical protein AVEN_272960-1 [Araneus ventricosus]|uniref:Uncharacterized protein n=1 Tax=Araneus ventricosus TaxID=182803 RepID=A0A4Y2AI68_ARAVE|nr:hypothetical protein AVEN_272960-1 [Araneus ventricosus]
MLRRNRVGRQDKSVRHVAESGVPAKCVPAACRCECWRRNRGANVQPGTRRSKVAPELARCECWRRSCRCDRWRMLRRTLPEMQRASLHLEVRMLRELPVTNVARNSQVKKVAPDGELILNKKM